LLLLRYLQLKTIVEDFNENIIKEKGKIFSILSVINPMDLAEQIFFDIILGNFSSVVENSFFEADDKEKEILQYFIENYSESECIYEILRIKKEIEKYMHHINKRMEST